MKGRFKEYTVFRSSITICRSKDCGFLVGKIYYIMEFGKIVKILEAKSNTESLFCRVCGMLQ